MSRGQAGRTHVLGLYEALRKQGWQGPLVAASPSSRTNLLGKLVRYVQVIIRAYRLLPELDLLYVRSHPIALFVVRAARHRGVPCVIEVNGTIEDLSHSHHVPPVLGRLLAAAERAQLRSTDRIVTVSEQLAQWVRSRHPSAVVLVVPNAADPQVFHPDAVTRLVVPARYVAFCGALTSWQGIDVVLAATQTRTWPADVSVLIAGRGALAPDVQREAELNPAVEYVGVVEQEDVAGLLAGSLAGLSPNTRRHHAGSAVKLYETLACGVPVVASDVEGQREFVTNEGVGLVYTAEDPESLADAVHRLAVDADLRSRLRQSASRVALDNTWRARAALIDEFVAPSSTEGAGG